MQTTATLPTDRPFNPLGVDYAPYDQAVARMQELGERLLEGTRMTTMTALDAYDKAVRTMAGAQIRFAESSGVDWFATQARLQAGFYQDLNTSLTQAMRAALG